MNTAHTSSKDDFLSISKKIIENQSLETFHAISYNFSSQFDKIIQKKLEQFSYFHLPFPKIRFDFKDNKLFILCSSSFYKTPKNIEIINHYSDFLDLTNQLSSNLESVYDIVETLSTECYEETRNYAKSISNFFSEFFKKAFENELSKYNSVFGKVFTFSLNQSPLSFITDFFEIHFKFSDSIPTDNKLFNIVKRLVVSFSMSLDSLNDLNSFSYDIFISQFVSTVEDFDLHNHKGIFHGRNIDSSIETTYIDFDSNDLFSVVTKEGKKLLRIGYPSFSMKPSEFIDSMNAFLENQK